MKSILPANDRILVKPIDEGEQTYGSIVIPDMGKERPEMGEVVAVGPGHTVMGGNFIPTQLTPGDIVVLPTLGFTKFEYEGEEYWIGKENEVLAKILKTEETTNE